MPHFIIPFALCSLFFSTHFFATPKSSRMLAVAGIKIGGDKVEIPRAAPPAVPVQLNNASTSPEFSAASVLIKDEVSGLALLTKDSYAERPMASITKLMSALVLFEQVTDWQTTTTVGRADLNDPHLASGEVYKLDDLWTAGLVASSNKAILALVEASHLNEATFVARMNTKATELGLLKTHFVEPTGLDSGNVSTASDIAILLAEALRNEKISTTLRTTEYTLRPIGLSKQKHHFWNTNWLRLGWIPNGFSSSTPIIGKTGYTDAALYNVAVRIAHPDGRVVLAVVLGSSTNESRFVEAKLAADWAFANFSWPE